MGRLNNLTGIANTGNKRYMQKKLECTVSGGHRTQRSNGGLEHDSYKSYEDYDKTEKLRKEELDEQTEVCGLEPPSQFGFTKKMTAVYISDRESNKMDS